MTALGVRGRSGEQFDIWRAGYSPTAEDGYPQPIFDKMTGVINHRSAEYWREHYDLDSILKRDWTLLGPNAEHCWNGDPEKPNRHSRLHYNQMYVPQIMDQKVNRALNCISRGSRAAVT